MQKLNRILVLATLSAVASQASAQQAFMPGDVAFGRSTNNATTTLAHIRLPSTPGLGTDVGTQWGTTFMQSVEFDNLNGIRHNARGNLLGLNFGTAAAGGSLAIFATGAQNAANPQNSTTIYTFDNANLGTRTRVGGLSVAPNNRRIALTGSDPAVTGELNGRLIVMDYTAGDGNAAGASVSNPIQVTIPLINGRTTGTTWLDSNRVMLLSRNDENFTVGDLYVVDVTDPLAPQVSVVATDLFQGFNLTFTSISFEPTVSPYIAISGSGFSGGTVNKLRLIDPTNFNPVSPLIDYSTSVNTLRELHWDENGNLITGAFGGSTAVPTGGILEAIVGAYNPANLADNSGNAKLFERGSISTSFNGHDVALTHVDYVNADVTVDIGTGSFTQKFLGASPESAVFAKLVAGYNGGSWDGPGGILSSAAATDSTYGIGYAFGSDTFTLSYTLKGDTNLDGIVTFPDLLSLAQNYGTVSGKAWVDGDSNYDGSVDFPDLLALAQNYSTSSLNSEQFDLLANTAGFEFAAFAQSVIPEPTTLALVAGAGLLALRRRA
jgi:hypothetical protein